MPVLSDKERIGSTVDTYRLGPIIGRGGMGTVFEAVHTWTQRRVAVKFLHPDYARNEEAARRFLREAQAAASLHHPNVVDVLDMGQDHGGVYIVLEFLEGESLRSLLSRQPRLGVDETLQYLLPVLDALSRAHGMSIVHRDLKPENIFLSIDGKGRTVPKLLDFGIAKIAGAGSSVVTSAGAMLGTPAYMAPEQVSDTPNVGITADVWAIGVVMYECLSGSLPFNATNPASLFMRILTEEVPPLQSRVPDLPEALCAVVQRALKRSPIERYASADALAAALREAVWGTAANMFATPMPVRVTPSEAEQVRGPWSATVRLEDSAIERPSVQRDAPASAQRAVDAAPAEPRLSGSSSGWSWSVIRNGPAAGRPTSRWRWILLVAFAVSAVGAAVWLRARPGAGPATDENVVVPAAPAAAAPAPVAPAAVSPLQDVAHTPGLAAPPAQPAAAVPSPAPSIGEPAPAAPQPAAHRARTTRRTEPRTAPRVQTSPATPSRQPERLVPAPKPAPAQAAPRLSEDF